MHKTTTVIALLFLAFMSYCIWSGKQFYTPEEKIQSASKITQEECEGTLEYIEDWDKYGNDLGKSVCIPFEE